MVLEQNGHSVAEARHGADALAQMESDRPDIVVADRKMPIVTGSELIQRMREDLVLSSIPVVMITGSSDARLLEPQPDAVLVKPFEPADLLQTIDRLTTLASAH